LVGGPQIQAVWIDVDLDYVAVAIVLGGGGFATRLVDASDTTFAIVGIGRYEVQATCCRINRLGMYTTSAVVGVRRDRAVCICFGGQQAGRIVGASFEGAEIVADARFPTVGVVLVRRCQSGLGD
jgi:hypothetical protein